MGRLSQFIASPRARRSISATVAAVVFVVLAGCAAQPPGSQPGTALGGTVKHLGSNISDYIKLGGNQVVIVPNGTYHASGTVSAPHAASTSGPLNGWLVLKAQSVGGVVVDLSHAPLTLD